MSVIVCLDFDMLGHIGFRLDRNQKRVSTVDLRLEVPCVDGVLAICFHGVLRLHRRLVAHQELHRQTFGCFRAYFSVVSGLLDIERTVVLALFMNLNISLVGFGWRRVLLEACVHGVEVTCCPVWLLTVCDGIMLRKSIVDLTDNFEFRCVFYCVFV